MPATNPHGDDASGGCGRADQPGDGLPASDLRPRVLAGAILSAFDAAWAAWIDDPGGRPLRAHMAEACDLTEGMSLPLLRNPPA